MIDAGTVVLDGDRIAWVGPVEAVPHEYDAVPSIDASGLTVLPGLIDAHMHISFGEARSEEELSIHTPMAYRAIRAVGRCRTGLAGRRDDGLRPRRTAGHRDRGA